jgi:hypothetical protein
MISAESDVRRHCFPSFQPTLVVSACLAFSLVHVAHSAYTDVSSPVVAPARKAGRVHADYARLRSLHDTRDKPFVSDFNNT